MKNKTFTKREQEVINLIIQAKNRKTIATCLAISVNTLDKHIYHIHLKTDTHTTSQLILYVLKGKDLDKNIEETILIENL